MITGTIQLNPPVEVKDSSFIIQVRDVSVPNAPDTVVQQFAFTGIYLDPGEPYGFTVDDENLSDGVAYSLFILMDRNPSDGTGFVPGDYLLPQPHGITAGQDVGTVVLLPVGQDTAAAPAGLPEG